MITATLLAPEITRRLLGLKEPEPTGWRGFSRRHSRASPIPVLEWCQDTALGEWRYGWRLEHPHLPASGWVLYLWFEQPGDAALFRLFHADWTLVEPGYPP
jgi:hypothetical protein